ncbi:MAG TPA: class I SAM-dependent methyltransferase, partial [Blastocatellia bacterium]
MATIEQNRQEWDRAWTDAGESWSQAWGGVRSQWFGGILPRIQAFIPAATILEIGPGYGRWTQFLIQHCRKLIAVDLAEECIRACQERFKCEASPAFFVNDGKSLDMIAEESVSFVFSFDSLVHADTVAIGGYLDELARKLVPDGVGFIHHSNLGAYTADTDGGLPHGVSNPHWRSQDMSAQRFEELC